MTPKLSTIHQFMREDPATWSVATAEMAFRDNLDNPSADYCRWLKEIPMEQRLAAVERDLARYMTGKQCFTERDEDHIVSDRN